MGSRPTVEEPILQINLIGCLEVCQPADFVNKGHVTGQLKVSRNVVAQKELRVHMLHRPAEASAESTSLGNMMMTAPSR